MNKAGIVVLVISVQNPSLIPLNPGWWIGSPRSWINIIANILGSIIPYNHQATRGLNTALVGIALELHSTALSDRCWIASWSSTEFACRRRFFCKSMQGNFGTTG